MRKHIISIMVILICITFIDKILIYTNRNIPKSIPTPVERFMERIAQIESDGNHKIVNRYGMLGMYQFSPSTIRTLGFSISKKEFLNNPHTQDTIMLAYMEANEEELDQLIRKYEGRVIHGVKITRASILAGAHFAGSTGMRNYLMSNGANTTVDGNGTSITKYIAHFRDIQLPPLKQEM